ncbi:hypothetical protein Tco_0945483 [Tanacetum coccineum]
MLLVDRFVNKGKMQHNVDMKKVSRVLWQSFLEEAECGNTNNNDIAMKEQANQEQTPDMMSDTKKWSTSKGSDLGEEGCCFRVIQQDLDKRGAHMLYCVVAEEQYNLAYFFVKRIECANDTSTVNLPYGMFLTRLYRYVMETYPHLDNGTFDIVERACRSISSLSSHHQGTSSHQYDDDDDDVVKTSRVSTLSPTTYLNSLHPLDYQNYQMPSSSEQTDETLFARQTTLLNQMQQMHEEMRGGFKSFGKALKGVFTKKKK